jgi:hypothetical protein
MFDATWVNEEIGEVINFAQTDDQSCEPTAHRRGAF